MAGAVLVLASGRAFAQLLPTEDAPTSELSDTTLDQRTVTLVAPAGHPALPQLRAELQALDLIIQEAHPHGAVVESDYRVVLGERQTEVWVADSQTHRTTLREVFPPADADPVARLTLVLQIVELLRTELEAPGPSRDIPVPLSAPAPPPARASRWVLSVVPQVIYSPGGTTVGAGAELDVVRHWSSVGLRGFVAPTLLPNRQSAREGVAQATPHFGGIQGVWLARDEGSPLVASLGTGVALIGTRYTASAKPGYRSRSDHLLAVAPVVDLRLGAPLGDSVAMVASGTLMIPLRSDRMFFDDREVARHGEALLTAGLGLQVTLP